MLKKILVPLDGSPLAEAVIKHVEELAAALKAEVTLLQVLSPSGVLTTSAEQQAFEANAYLRTYALAMQEKGIAAYATIRHGEAADEIVDYAQVNGMDLIAMSTHGRSGVSRLLFGSVALKVLRQAKVPVLLVRARRGAEAEAPAEAEIYE